MTAHSDICNMIIDFTTADLCQQLVCSYICEICKVTKNAIVTHMYSKRVHFPTYTSI